MNPCFLIPSQCCAPLVKQYVFIRTGSSEDYCNDRFIPNGTISIVFNFTGNVYYKENNTTGKLPRYFLVTPLLRRLEIEVKHPSDTLVVMCRASFFTRLFNLRLDLLSRTPYRELKTGAFDLLWQKLSESDSDEIKIQLLEDFITEKIQQSKLQYDDIDLIYDKIINIGGRVPVNEILKETTINPRTFRRLFLQRIGISAKSLSRIVRVNYLWERINNNNDIDFQNMVFEGGYYDQAHLIHDFKKIIGEPPETFFKRNLKQVKIISAKM